MADYLCNCRYSYNCADLDKEGPGCDNSSKFGVRFYIRIMVFSIRNDDLMLTK